VYGLVALDGFFSRAVVSGKVASGQHLALTFSQAEPKAFRSVDGLVALDGFF
jgi:hypothetical protein